MRNRSGERSTILRMAIVVIAGLVATTCTQETADAPAVPPKRPPQKTPPPLEDCPALARVAEGTGSLRLCNAPSSAARQECPSSEQIVVLVDNDHETAARRMGRDVPATNWQDLLLDLAAIGRTECPGGNRPLERLPGRCGTIQDAVHGWNFGACRTADGRLFPRFLTHGSGTTTPATEAVQRIAREMTRPGSTPGVTLMAFDGIVDGDYRNAAARLAFADAIADAVAAGVKVWIVASPAAYRYVYVFARPQFEHFAGNAAGALAVTLGERDDRPVVPTSLSESRYRDHGARLEVARVQIGKPRLHGVHWDFNGIALLRLQHTSAPRGEMWALDVRRWAATSASTAPYGAMVRLSWNAEPAEWDALVPFGVRLPPPSIRVNRPVHRTEETANAAWAHADGVDVGLLNDCGRRSARAPLAQGVSIAPGRADFLLIRGAAGNATWLSSDLQGWAGDASKLRTAVIASAGPPLAAAMLVTPRARPSRCTAALLDAYSGSYQWGSGRSTPELDAAAREPDCSSAQWRVLLESLRNVPYRRFRPGAASPWQPTDGRVAVETFLTVIETVARRTTNEASAAEDPYSCVLATFRIGSDTPRRSDARWKQERLQ